MQGELHYDTNVWGDSQWVMTQAHRLDQGEWSKKSKWLWYPVNKVELFRKRHNNTLVFWTINHYRQQEKASPQLANLCFDFDCGDAGDFMLAQRSVIAITKYFWDLDIPSEAMRYFFSGGRSYHMEIAYQGFGISPTQGLNLLMKHAASHINAEIMSDTMEERFPIDLTIYSNPRMWRMPNSYYPKYDAYKIELSYKEVWNLSEKELRELAKQPRDPLYDLSQIIYEPADEAVRWWQERVDEYQGLTAPKTQIPVNPVALKVFTLSAQQTQPTPSSHSGCASLQGGTPPSGSLQGGTRMPVCIADLRQNTIRHAGDRNKATMLDASFCKAINIPEADAKAIINDWVQRIPANLTSCKIGNERKTATFQTIEYLYKDPKYKFACGYAIGLGLACNGENCMLYEKHAFQKWTEHVKMIENFQPTVPPTQSRTVNDVRLAVCDDFKSWIATQHDEARLYRLAQGSGKTVTVLSTVRDVGGLRVIYAITRHEVLGELKKLGAWGLIDREILSRERIEQLKEKKGYGTGCPYYLHAEALAKKRWNVIRYLCSKKCEKQMVCDYFRQFMPVQCGEIVGLMQENLFISTYIDDLCHKMSPDAPNVVFIFDEPDPSKFIEQVFISSVELTRTIAKTPNRDVRTLLEVCRQTIEMAQQNKQRINGKQALFAFMANVPADTTLRHLVDGVKYFLSIPEKYVPVKIDAVLNGTDKAWQVAHNGRAVWIPKKLCWEDFDDPDNLLIWVHPKLIISRRLVQWIPEEGEIDDSDVPEVSHEPLLNFLDDLVNCLDRDLTKLERGEDFNSPLVITQIYDCPVLQLNLKRSFSVPSDCNLILLDGSGTPELLEQLIQRPVSTWTAPINPAAEVTQVIDGSYGITTLFDKKAGAPRKAFNRLLEAVSNIVGQAPEETVIITWKVLDAHLKKLQEAGEFDNKVAIDHYGNVEGKNDYQDKKQAILIGTPTPQEQDLIELGHAIWADDPTPLDTTMLKNDNWRAYQYVDKQGRGFAVEVREFTDDRLNMLLRNYREFELIQAAHRVRPVLHEGRKIYLLTNLPLDELPPTKLTTVRGLAGHTNPLYAVWKDMIEDIVEEYSGIFFEVAKRVFDTDVVYNNTYYIDVKNTLTTRTLYRWFSVAVAELGYISNKIVVGRFAPLKVWHSGALDIDKITALYQNLQIDGGEKSD